jgi:hypothetical protein
VPAWPARATGVPAPKRAPGPSMTSSRFGTLRRRTNL